MTDDLEWFAALPEPVRAALHLIADRGLLDELSSLESRVTALGG